jgi:formate-dependent nitrite reductase membrane component NrfD
MDPKFTGQLQKEWGWLIAVYLFLGGLGGGAYALAAVNSVLGGRMTQATTVGLWIGFAALALGSIFLIADLGQPKRAVLAGKKPGRSWIARGFWIISTFMALSLLHLVLQVTGAAEGAGVAMRVLAILGFVFAILTMAYTGMLLGSSKGIPFWRSAVVPVLFVTSALVTGAFATILGTLIAGGGADRVAAFRVLTLEASVLVLAELLVLFFFLQAGLKQPDSRESVRRMVKKPSFLVGDLILGLLVPLALTVILYFSLYGIAGELESASLGAAWVAAVLGLIGGLLLRQAVLTCGALPTLNIAGFQFRRVAKPKEPKPGIDLLPPGP